MTNNLAQIDTLKTKVDNDFQSKFLTNILHILHLSILTLGNLRPAMNICLPTTTLPPATYHHAKFLYYLPPLCHHLPASTLSCSTILPFTTCLHSPTCLHCTTFPYIHPPPFLSVVISQRGCQGEKERERERRGTERTEEGGSGEGKGTRKKDKREGVGKG